MWKRNDDQEQISTKDLQMRVECSTMKVKNARVFRQHGSSGRCGVRRRNKAGPPWPTFFIPCARPVKRQAMRELPRFPRREQVVWNGGCHVLSRRFSWGFRHTQTRGLPWACPALPGMLSDTLRSVCRPGVAYGSSHVLRPVAATLPGVQTSKTQSPSRAFSKLFTALGSWPSCMRKH